MSQDKYMERLEIRLLQNAVKADGQDCWLWRGQISNAGHGRIKMRDEDGFMHTVSAEKASFLVWRGAIPENHLVVQNCGDRLCINPDHLILRNLQKPI